VDGEEQLLLHAADNGEAPKQIGSSAPGWHFARAWSPDGKRIAWGDEKYRLLVGDLTAKTPEVVDRGEWEINRYVWSPDSRYLAYEVTQSNLFTQIRIWDSESKKTHEATEPAY